MELRPIKDGRGSFVSVSVANVVTPPSLRQNNVTASFIFITLQWRHNDRDGVSNNQPHDCLLRRLFKAQNNETPKLRVTGLCAGNSPMTGEFPAQMASNAENVSI